MTSKQCGFVYVSINNFFGVENRVENLDLDEQHRLHFIPSQIYGVIRVSLLPVLNVRKVMIEILCNMIYTVNKYKNNLSIFENEFVSVMDRFANEPAVNKKFKEYLINAYVFNYSAKHQQ